jgi:hypothetical protein
MSDPAILFVKPKAVSAADKKALRNVGVVVVEVENPAEVKFIRAARESAELAGGPLLRAAAKAINDTGSEEVKKMFAKAVCAAIAGIIPDGAAE